MNSSSFDIAIVGTGIPGLAASLGFAQQGFSVALIGPRMKHHASTRTAPFDARIYAVAPASVALLEQLGAWATVDQQRVCPVERMRVFGDAGDELTFDAYGATVERLATIVEEGELLRVLDAACGFQPALKRIHSSFVSTGAEPDSVHINLEGGGTVAARLLIGADGANSSVRAAAGISASVKEYLQAAVVANFKCARPHLNTAWQWFTDEGVVALLPLPGEYVSLVWSTANELATELAASSADHLAARVTERCAAALGELTAIGATQTFPLRLITVSRLIASRVALVADAAHVVHPLAGQGLNLGLQDVALLLEVIRARESFRDIGDTTLLRRYERGRAEAIGLMRFTTDGLAQLFAFDDPLARRLRNVGLAAVNRLSPLKNALIRQALG
ncbi:MAG TPA: UbiH/UbiF family hydroxylase [Burkholderiaceae bacterium]|nr:UbiH/UbiF family hydroxylase [Burkholderiaceae bacterium]